jgi:hypothetical protein
LHSLGDNVDDDDTQPIAGWTPCNVGSLWDGEARLCSRDFAGQPEDHSPSRLPRIHRHCFILLV